MKKYKQPLKLAFIGGGVNSAIGYTHYIASQMDHLFILTAGCFSRIDSVNEETGNKWGIKAEHLYSDWEELLESEKENIDAVVILTPTPNHHEMVMKALSLGHSVICEKSLAATYEEALEISEKVDEEKAFLAVTHNYTGYPMLRELQKMILDSKLGRVTHINIEMPQESFGRVGVDGEKPTPQHWRLGDSEIPGISLDLGTHLQHLIYFLTNENPIEIVADESSFGWFDKLIDNIYVISRYSSGMKVQMWYGKVSIGHRNGLRVRVYGEKGSAEWFQMNPEELLFNTVDGNRMIMDRAANVSVTNQLRYNRFKSGHPAGFIEAFGNLYFDIAEKLRLYQVDKENEVKWSYSASQAAMGLKVFQAIQKSSKENSWVKIKY